MCSVTILMNMKVNLKIDFFNTSGRNWLKIRIYSSLLKNSQSKNSELNMIFKIKTEEKKITH